MASEGSSQGLLVYESPAGVWERDAAKRALDELFSLTCQYKRFFAIWCG